MTKIYCLKCKAFTETDNEGQDISKNRRYRLLGKCTECGKIKYVFTDENYNFEIHKKKSAKEKTIAKEKRKMASLNWRAKKLGKEILDADKGVQKSVRQALNNR